MTAYFSKIWFWFIMLVIFLTLILYDFDFEKEVTVYQKTKMHLLDVHFSELDLAFEHARIYADEVDMDESQSNMIASRVRALFFDKEVATKAAELIASSASRNSYELMFWGDVRGRTTENERFRSDELRYYSSRKEVYTAFPVTIWKDDMIITGKELRVNTQTKESTLSRDVVIRIWGKGGSETASLATMPVDFPGFPGSFSTMVPLGGEIPGAIPSSPSRDIIPQATPAAHASETAGQKEKKDIR